MNAALDNYLKQHGNGAKLARLTGLTAPTISRMKTGRTDITLRSAMMIEVATNGELKADELLANTEEIELVRAFRSRQ